MITLVYPVGRGRGQMLRWSLRSVHAAAAGAEVRIVICGALPDYINRRAPGLIVVAVPQGRNVFENVWGAWERAADTVDRDGPWWWMNDDFFMTGALPDALAPSHLGPLKGWIQAIGGQGVSLWVRRAQTALDALMAAGHDPMCWETHRPLYVDPGNVYGARHFLAEAGIAPRDVAQRTVIATLAGRTGPALPDPKIGPREGPMLSPLVSTSPTSWKGPLGRQIRAAFPHRSPWER
jgi:hypothetical protein